MKKIQLIYCDCSLLLKEIGCNCKWWHHLLVPICEFLPFTTLSFGKYKLQQVREFEDEIQNN